MGSVRACAPYAAMLIVQLSYAGSNILSKLALEDGLSCIVFIVYRHLIAMFLLGLLALLFERKQLASLTWPILGNIFLLALLGVTIHQTVYYQGLKYSSATVASALSNVIPAVTFVLAVVLRMEKVGIETAKGQAKIVGTVICITGALVFTFCKGFLFRGFVEKPLIVIGGPENQQHDKEDWMKGSCLILTSLVAYSAWLILQAKICKVYQAKLSMNTIICFFASLQSSVLAIILERNTAAWKLQWNIQLYTIIYCGIMISGLAYYLQTWSIGEKGPVFAAMFTPLLLIIVGVFSALFFAERLHLGNLLGAMIIVLGLYCVLWGKSKENEMQGKTVSLPN